MRGNLSSRDIKYFRIMLEKKEKELQELQAKLSVIKKEERGLEQKISESGRGLRKKQLESRRIENEVRLKEVSKKRRQRELQDLERELRHGDHYKKSGL